MNRPQRNTPNNHPLAVLRRSLGLSQDEFAHGLGCTREAVSRWEHGHSDPSGRYLEIIRAIQDAVHDGAEPAEVGARLAEGGIGMMVYWSLRADIDGMEGAVTVAKRAGKLAAQLGATEVAA